METMENESIVYKSSLDDEKVIELIREEFSPEKVNFTKEDDDDQRPVSKKVHSFYFVKFRPIETENLKSMIVKGEKFIKTWDREWIQVNKNLQQRKWGRDRINLWLSYRPEMNYSKEWMDLRMREMEFQQQVLGELCFSLNLSQGRFKYALSPVEELNHLIMNLHRQLHHGRDMNRAKEKQLHREINKAKAERETLVAEVAKERTKHRYSYQLDSREAIQNRIKATGTEIEKLKKQDMEDRARSRATKENLEQQLEAAEKDITYSLKRLDDINKKKAEAYKRIYGLREQIHDVNACFREYLKVWAIAKKLSRKKDVEGLMELSKRQVENFMSEWSKSKDFRDDYERREAQKENLYKPPKNNVIDTNSNLICPLQK